MKRRVAITGTGIVSSLGIGSEKFWHAVKNGKSGISKIERIDLSDIPTKVGAEIKDFDPNEFIEKKQIKRTDRFAQYALAATQMAIENAKLDLETLDKERLGVIIGTGIGGIETLENQHQVLLEKGAGRVSAFFVPMMLPNMASGLIAINTGPKVSSNVL